MAKSTEWGSRIGFILASAGSAIGLGAIWKFPFWAGANGGGNFIIPYIIFTFTIGVALLMAEASVGRAGRGSAVQAMKKMGGPFFAIAGFIGVISSFLILSYYSVVGGWCVSYLIGSLTNSVLSSDEETLKEGFAVLVSDPVKNVFWHFCFLTLTCGVVALGVEKGIERIAKFLMPLLFILMVVILIRSLTFPGAMKGVEFLFAIHPETMSASTILNALGFTFFSLSLGCGTIVTYGCYVKETTDIPSSSGWIAFLALLGSILSGLMILPAVFAFGLDPNAGPGLVFVTLPIVFDHFPGGAFFAVLFYICLLTAALTSSISMLEVVIAYLGNEWNVRRPRGCFACWIALFLFGCVSALSFGPWSDVKVFGKTLFDALDFLSSNILLPMGGLFIALLTGWIAWPKFKEQLNYVKNRGTAYTTFIHAMVAIIAPIVVLLVIYQGCFA